MVLFSDIQLFSLEYKFFLNILIKFHNANQKKKNSKETHHSSHHLLWMKECYLECSRHWYNEIFH